MRPHRRPLSGVRRFVASFGPALAVLVVGIATFDVIARFRDSRGWVEHTRQVLAAAQDARIALVDIETGHRGFLIAGEPSYLAPYYSGLQALREDTLRLRRLTSDNVAQQRRLNVLSPLIREHVALLDSSVAYQRDGRALVALSIVRRGRSKALMDSARTTTHRGRPRDRGYAVAPARRARYAAAAGMSGRSGADTSLASETGERHIRPLLSSRESTSLSV